MTDQNQQEFTDQEWAEAFLAETTLFLGPDPEIMNDHRMAPRTAEEDRLLSGPVDANDLDRVRKRIVAGLDEAFEMMEQTGAAAWPHGNIPGVTAWLGSAAADVLSGPWGVVASAGFWDGGKPDQDAELVLVPVPAQADPEAVMKRVRALA